MPQTDDSEGVGHLRRAELNPLLNPILAQNLGRWAEVYYTSPPETREQAVEELVRELEAQQLETQQLEAQNGQENSRFSSEERVSAVEGLASFQPSPGPAANGALPQRQAMDPETWSTDSLRRDLSNPQGFGTTWYTKLATAPRLYLLAAFAFAILGALILGYMMRGSGNAPAADASQPANPPPAASAVPATRPATRPDAEAAVPRENNPALQSGPAQEPAVAAKTSPRPAKARPDPAASAAPASTAPAGFRPVAAPVAATPAAATRQPGTLQAGGFEELAVAKNYLNENGSKPRNTDEAVKWLWKAVAKQNAEATGLLATLYLEGDGVPKNCDQARLLLDAAARKGIKGAAERLGHLEAFGCQ